MRIWPLCSLVFLLGCGEVVETGVVEISSGGEPTRVRIELESIEQGKSLSHAIRLRNPSDSEVEIARLDTSCDCATVSPVQVTLGPGEQALAELIVDLEDEPEFVGQLGIEIEAYDNQNQKLLELLALLDVITPEVDVFHAVDQQE